MPAVTIGGQSFRIRTSQREGRWTAYAVRASNGDRFGTDVVAETEVEAVAGVTRWLEWQREHAVALGALQDAERAYHRTVAGAAFAGAAEGTQTLQARRESLVRLETARVRLDEIRARRPG